MNKSFSIVIALAFIFSGVVPATSHAKSNKGKIKNGPVTWETVSSNKIKIEAGNDDDGNEDDELCPTGAFGHLIAPGWMKTKHNGERPEIPDDCKLPKGIWKKYYTENGNGRKPTSTDVTAPIISNIGVHASTTSAVITWTTNESATSRVAYGTSTTYTNLSAFNKAKVTSHSVTLTGLATNTAYHFSVRSRDASGNATSSANEMFTTLPIFTDTTAPAISNIATGSSTSTATIMWTTNEPADSQIIYGTSAAYGSSTTINTQLVTSHSVTIANLNESTTYHFAIRSRDAANNLATSTDYTLTTLSIPDTTAPIISLAAASTTASSALVSWSTDEPASSKVLYSTSSPVDTNSTSTPFVNSSALVTNHLISLLGLNANTTYYLVIESADAANNSGIATTSIVTVP